MKAVSDFHKAGYYHFDLKPHNITIQEQTNPKQPYRIRLIDFGDLRTSIFYRTGTIEKNNLFTFPVNSSIGTAGHIQKCILENPKQRQEIPPKTIEQMEKKDSFALGMTFVFTVFQKHLDPTWQSPEFGTNGCQPIREFIEEFYPHNVDTPFLIEKELNGLSKLVVKMIAPKFEDRITVKQAQVLWQKTLIEESER